jgi:predicted transcriptional regulator
MVRIDTELLKRVDQRAERLSISRSAFIVQGAAEKLERTES